MVAGNGELNFPKRTWQRPPDVSPNSGIGDQLALMRRFASCEIDGAEFARSWYAARGRSLEAKERVRPPFEFLLDRVFFALEDYPIDPLDREDGDITEDQLRAAVCDALVHLDKL
ncbi:hypothetical protein [Nocardia sp. NPDC003183]